MRISWNELPLLRILIPFMIGLFLVKQYVNFFTFNIPIALAFTLLFLLLLSLADRYYFRKRWKQQVLYGVGLQLFMLLLGMLYGSYDNHQAKRPNIPENKQVIWVGEVREVTEKSDRGGSLKVDLIYLYRDSSWQPVNGKAQFYFKQENQFKVGDQLAAASYFQPFEKPLNPAQFDFRQFNANREIYYYAFEDDFQFLQHRNSLLSKAASVRRKIEAAYVEMGIQADELAVLKALTLGDKKQISPELKANFAQVGAMHILAVSGLHVGIIFLIINQLLSFLGKKLFQRWLKAVLLLFVIWSFALVTGWSPSVQRASWMFSFIILSTALNRKGNVLNSLAASAFLLLLYNPNILFEVGFQLSYAAVVGIVLIYPKLYPFFKTPWSWLNKVIGLLVVSLAAQMATLPLSIYYFHQFPNWFLLTNLFAIPLAFAIVSLGLFTVFVFLITAHDFYLAEILNQLLRLLNYLVAFSTELPYPSASSIWLNLFSVVLLYFCLAALVFYLYFKFKPAFMLALSFLLLLVGLEFYIDFKQMKKREIGIYALNAEVISFINGLEAEIFVNDSILDPFDEKIVRQHLAQLRVKKVSWYFEHQDFSQTKNFHFKQLEGGKQLQGLNQKIQLIESLDSNFVTDANALILSSELNLDELLFPSIDQNMNLILSAKIPSWSSQHIEFSKKIPVHFLQRDGYIDLLKMK